MNLNDQIEQKKKKRAIMSDFEIDTTYIRELAAEALNANEKALQNPAFLERCQTLRNLCDQLAVSVLALKEMIPGANPVPLAPEE